MLWSADRKEIDEFVTPVFLTYLENILFNKIYCKFTIYILEM